MRSTPGLAVSALSWPHAAAVALGGGAGALLRWLAGVWLNPLAAPLALGTLAVNLLGGLMIGMSLVWFARMPDEFLRLLLVTGLLGGLTTFSAFSAESLSLLLRGQWGWAAAHTLLHVAGSLVAANLGWHIGRWLWA